jgi:hypothetical protein
MSQFWSGPRRRGPRVAWHTGSRARRISGAGDNRSRCELGAVAALFHPKPCMKAGIHHESGTHCPRLEPGPGGRAARRVSWNVRHSAGRRRVNRSGGLAPLSSATRCPRSSLPPGLGGARRCAAARRGPVRAAARRGGRQHPRTAGGPCAPAWKPPRGASRIGHSRPNTRAPCSAVSSPTGLAGRSPRRRARGPAAGQGGPHEPWHALRPRLVPAQQQQAGLSWLISYSLLAMQTCARSQGRPPLWLVR